MRMGRLDGKKAQAKRDLNGHALASCRADRTGFLVLSPTPAPRNNS
jgi:hypothetical protein